MKTVRDFIFLGSKITANGDCSHEIKRHLLLGRKVMTNLSSVQFSRSVMSNSLQPHELQNARPPCPSPTLGSPRLVIIFLPRSKHLLISWLQSPSAVILEPPKIKSDTVSTVSPSIYHEVMGPETMIFVF